jgi:outer membrane receptor protein involved in Fe transport
MPLRGPWFALALLGCALATTAQAQEPATEQTPPPAPEEASPPGDVVVVTASRHEEQLINAPVTMTVIPESVIDGAPSQSLTDLLRMVPGINTVQTSARDINVTSRAATGTLSDSLLVLLDGRSIYQDLFGFVMWDLLPVDTAEIKQVEVIRGPASAVWGANAMTGVVNVISKTPREMEGSSVSIRFGQFDRTRPGQPFDGGGLFAVNAIHAEAPDDRFAFKVSAGFLTQEPFLRPDGSVPGTQTPYPAFTNKGTSQQRLDARADYDFADGRRTLILAGGLAATQGLLYTGLGPLDVQRGSMLKYGRITYTRERLKLQFFVNDLDGEAPFLLLSDSDGHPLRADVENQAYDVEASNANVLGTRHLLAYGGNFRHNSFDISLAPRGHRRDEGGVYVQDQIFLSARFRWFLGARVDRLGILDKAILSPRTSFIVKPRPNQSVRLSFNRAFRAPSFVDNFFGTTFLTQVDLGPAGLFRFPTAGVGNLKLQEERLTAYEIGYIARLRRGTIDAAFYVNHTRNSVLFTQTQAYTSANPPPAWPLPPAALDELNASGRGLPAQWSYRNFDRIADRGVEVSLDTRITQSLTAFANYSWQDDPVPRGFDISELNLPPTHRVNAGLSYAGRRYFGSVSASYHDDAFWQDVLDARFWGRTERYTLVDAGVGVHSSDGSMTISVRATNLLNNVSQQHVFGDLIRRTVTCEVRFFF